MTVHDGVCKVWLLMVPTYDSASQPLRWVTLSNPCIAPCARLCLIYNDGLYSNLYSNLDIYIVLKSLFDILHLVILRLASMMQVQLHRCLE